MPPRLSATQSPCTSLHLNMEEEGSYLLQSGLLRTVVQVVNCKRCLSKEVGRGGNAAHALLPKPCAPVEG